MGTAPAHEVINIYQVGQVEHFLSADDGELYFGEVVGVVHDRLNGRYKIMLTLTTEFGFITIRVY